MTPTPRLAPALALLAALLLAPPLALAGEAMPATPARPAVTSLGSDARTVLYVGNSFFYYNNSMHHLVDGLSKAGDPEHAKEYRSTSITISGAGLNWHDVESYFKPGGVASYSFVGNNEVRFNKLEKPFDVVIMNDCSQCPIHPQLKGPFIEYAKKHSDTVRKHGAKPVLFMTWAYADKPEMTAPLAEQYTIAGNENQALVVPAGLAFAKALQKRPSLVLLVADKRHPTPAGSYLAACAIYASVFGKSPVGNPYTEHLDKETARFLQEVAWETVREYYAGSAS
jgi:hypothetical protein